MEGKNGQGSSSSRTPNEQRSPQRAEGSTPRQPSSTQRQPPSIQRQPPPPPPPRVQEPAPARSRSHGTSSLGDRVWGRMPHVNFLHAVPVGGSSEGHATGGSSIGGSATDAAAAASRKRVRDQSSTHQGVVAPPGRGAGDPFPFSCTVCGKGFLTDKSLFGHMRTHRGRPWKGALPPPVFSREEFADTGLLNPVGGEDEEEDEQGVDLREGTPARTREGRGQPQGGVLYRVPDLNRSPPEEGNGDDDDNN